jgi:hypothetical protein
VFRPGGYIGVQADPGATPVVPGALVWDAHLAENEISKESLMRRLFDISEMSPVLFAGNLAGMAESGTALRLRLTNTLAKCGRIRRKVDGAAKKALNLGMALEDMPVEGLKINWQDGLPTIPLEEAQRISMLVTSKARSAEGLMREAGMAKAQIAQEMTEIMMNQPTMM